MTDVTRAILIGILAVATLMLAWQLSAILLLALAGMLLAALLDAAVRPLDRVLPLPRPLIVVLVTLLIAGLFIGGLSWGGFSLWQSVEEFWSMISNRATELYERFGEDLNEQLSSQNQTLMQDLLPNPAELFSQAGSIFGLTLGVLGNIVIIGFLGLFFAINPAGYRDSVLILIPARYRARWKDAFDHTGEALRGWLVTQLAVMILIGLLVFTLLTLLGSPDALLLGVLAGVLNFIPYLGPIISAVPVLLTLAGQDMTALWIGALGLLLIQNIEGYVITPLLQQRIIELPPAWSLITMAVMGALFGPMGVALATPLFAVSRTLTQKLYIEPRDAGKTGQGHSP